MTQFFALGQTVAAQWIADFLCIFCVFCGAGAGPLVLCGGWFWVSAPEGGRGSGKSVGQFADGRMDIPSQPLDTPTDILVLWGMGWAQGVPEKWRGVFWKAAAEISETKNENFVAYSSG